MTPRRLWIMVLILALLTPLGLWLPERLGAGDAWGEWGAEDVADQVGFLPRGLARLAGLWKAPVPDYAPAGWEEKPLAVQSAAYIASAVTGILVCGLVIWLLGRWLSTREKANAP
ncbi:MAG: cobalamin biosynthesis protein [Armatimonadota bacterium]|nr:cobalamin biosynthesis protein [Armatimonadota bacterium]